MSKIIGRKQEIEELDRLYYSDRPEFVAVYGRRRVGKTFLIKQPEFGISSRAFPLLLQHVEFN